MISIDQIRFYIPYVANKFRIEDLDELRLTNKIFALSDYFEIKAESKGQNGYIQKAIILVLMKRNMFR